MSAAAQKRKLIEQRVAQLQRTRKIVRLMLKTQSVEAVNDVVLSNVMRCVCRSVEAFSKADLIHPLIDYVNDDQLMGTVTLREMCKAPDEDEVQSHKRRKTNE